MPESPVEKEVDVCSVEVVSSDDIETYLEASKADKDMAVKLKERRMLPIEIVREDGRQIFVARGNNRQIVGLLAVKPTGNELTYKVDPDYHGAGIAGRLVQGAIDWARRVGKYELVAFVENNSVSMRVLKKRGFAFSEPDDLDRPLTARLRLK